MLDMGVEPFLVASSVEAILAQRLVRTICKHCKEEYEPDPLDVPPDFNLKPGQTVFRGKGCRDCRNSGFSGRKGIFEFMMMTDDIRELVLERASAGKIRKVALNSGMVMLREDGWNKVRAGITTISEVVRATKG